jgi:hypothetical protein
MVRRLSFLVKMASHSFTNFARLATVSLLWCSECSDCIHTYVWTQKTLPPMRPAESKICKVYTHICLDLADLAPYAAC